MQSKSYNRHCYYICIYVYITPVATVRKSWPIGWRGSQTNPNKTSTKATQKATKALQKATKKTTATAETHQSRHLKIRDINQRKLPVNGKTMTNVYTHEPDHPLFDVDTATHWIYPTSEIFERRQYQVFVSIFLGLSQTPSIAPLFCQVSC